MGNDCLADSRTVSRQRRWQLRQTAQGRCQICGKRSGQRKMYCPTHALANGRHVRKCKATHTGGDAMSDDDVRAAAERLLNEHAIHRELDSDGYADGFADDIETVARHVLADALAARPGVPLSPTSRNVHRMTPETMKELADLVHARSAGDERAAAEVERVTAERDKLQRFKDWVHNYLDTHGVPHHPPGTHGAEGCRIGDRMDWLMERVNQLAEAAQPSAVLGGPYDDTPAYHDLEDDVVLHSNSGHSITAGDVRDLRRTLARLLAPAAPKESE